MKRCCQTRLARSISCRELTDRYLSIVVRATMRTPGPTDLIHPRVKALFMSCPNLGRKPTSRDLLLCLLIHRAI